MSEQRVIVKQTEQKVSVEQIESRTIVRVEQQSLQVKNLEVVKVFQDGVQQERYVQGFSNTSSFTVLATTHGVQNVRGVTLLDDQQIEMLANVTINQANQNVTVQFGLNQTGTIIIY